MSSKNQDIFQDSPLKDSIRAKIDNSFTAIPDTKPLQGGGQDKAAKGNAKAPGKGAAAARYVIGAIGLILVLGLYMASAMLLSDTLMPAWLPWVIAVPVALATGLPCGQWWHVVTGCWKRWVNMTVHVLVVTAVLAFSFVLANDRGAKGEPVKTEVTVERLYRETRHHTKRVSRRHYAQGPAYYVYFATVRFADGQTRNCSISKELHDKLTASQAATVETREGLFGYDVYDPKTLSQPGMDKKKKKSRRTRYVGPRPR